MVEPTLRSLLARDELALRLTVPVAALPAGSLDAEVDGIHSTDLLDPTPFLGASMMLLTTGTQFAPDVAHPSQADVQAGADYVRRLLSHGVLGLGFGTEVARVGIPWALEQACREQGLPLFEVPYRTPFIAIAQANAQAVAARAYARRSWSLTAQRALTMAALRRDGVEATVAELAEQLGGWVGLYDAGGALRHQHPVAGSGVQGERRLGEQLQGEIDGLLRRGSRGVSIVEVDGARLTVQSLGRGGHLRGALAVGGADLDHEARRVVSAAVATIGLALEQQVVVDRAERALNRGLATMLTAGEVDRVVQILGEIGTDLPREPVVVALVEAEAVDRGAQEWLGSRLGRAPGRFFAGGVQEGLLVMVPAAHGGLLEELTQRFGVRVGASAPARYVALAGALDQARVTLGRGTGGVTWFSQWRREGVLSALAGEDARAVAGAMLAPVREHDARHGASLEVTIRAWVEGDCSNENAARSLGVHRHTVRTRLDQAQRLLGLELTSFADRAELWAALRLGDVGPSKAGVVG